MSGKEDVLLKAMETDLDLLYGLWTISQSAPSKCAEILMTYRDVVRGCSAACESLSVVKKQMDEVESAGDRVKEMIAQVQDWKAELRGIDEDVFLNRMNRLCDLAERIEKVKRSGALKTLRALIEDDGGVR